MEDPGILVVDDDRKILEVLERFFEYEGIKVRCAASGEEALAIIRERPSVLITDLHMPGMNGIELAGRARIIVPDLQVVLTTSDTSPEVLDLASKAGIAKVLSKPFHMVEMLAAVRDGEERRRRSEMSSAGERIDDTRVWLCPGCGTRYEGLSSLNLCYKCGCKGT